MRKVESERRADGQRRNAELQDARAAMQASGAAGFLGFVALSYKGRREISRGNFQDWPRVSMKGPRQVERGTLNGIPTRFVAQRTLTAHFTDVGFSVSVDINKSKFQGRRKISQEVQQEIDETNSLNRAEVLGKLASIIRSGRVLSPMGKEPNYELMDIKLAEMRAPRSIA